MGRMSNLMTRSVSFKDEKKLRVEIIIDPSKFNNVILILALVSV